MGKIKREMEKTKTPNTGGFCIGSPEAEAEATNAQIKLEVLFEDYLDVVSQLDNEKFIILGRKGCGKTAIGEYIYRMSLQEPNVFCKFVKKSDVDIEYLVQIGKNLGVTLEYQALYKWVVLTQLITLFFENEKLKSNSRLENLKKFIERNRGFVDIDKNQVSEIVKNKGWEIRIEYLNRIFDHKISTKESKAPFYKIIPYLEEAVIKVMKDDSENSYFLIFDDLDVGFNANSNESIETTIGLLRTSRYYNNDVFGRNELDSKIILLLRDDISRALMYNADTAKMLSSYSIKLDWYEDCFRDNELRIKLRKFINKRISKNFIMKGIIVNDKNDPWKSFVDENQFSGSKTGFKYVLDQTFYRPRDLIVFFRDISDLQFELPISKGDLDILKKKYASEALNELTNELSLIFSKNDIQCIWSALRYFNNRSRFSYDELKEKLQINNISVDVDEVINNLFDYSIIGNISDKNKVSFKFREKDYLTCGINKDEKFILHYVLQTYFG